MNNKQYDVINTFNKDIDIQKIKSLEKNHPYISDKLILDLINGVNVVARDHHETLKKKEGFNRFFGTLTGNSKKHQDMINENLIEGLNSCASWFLDHDKKLSSLDKRINGIVENTLNHFSKIKEKNKELEDKFKKFQEISINRFEKVEKEIKSLKIHTIIDREITSLEANTKYEMFEDISLKIFLFMDNLFSGELGLLDMTKDDINYLKNKLLILIEKRNINKTDYINFEDIFYTINKIPNNLEKEAISYISNHQVDFLNMQNTKSVISDLIKISSISNEDVFKKEIKENSKISEFITYENYIDMSIREFI
ncbi:MAG: hypothetical protein RBR70_10900 [Arcobacter sp.]|jgi:hypothetical protein|uniref:hypothetical protein n=1 Tax=Arcobacter sp. TaxID=1872629 RepID=UPI002A763C49|nr:hypothetical protein [Arcobacter sp.]MDY3205567.1 hypothetical protein [Arcobacter sp.]